MVAFIYWTLEIGFRRRGEKNKNRTLLQVVSQREQVLVVPMTNLEDVRKNITESANGQTDEEGDSALIDTRPFVEDGGRGSYVGKRYI